MIHTRNTRLVWPLLSLTGEAATRYARSLARDHRGNLEAARAEAAETLGAFGIAASQRFWDELDSQCRSVRNGARIPGATW